MLKTLAVVLLALVMVGAVMAQDQAYLLKDYMPQTVGSKWIMKTTNQQGETTNTIEIGEAKEIGGQKALPILTKNKQGEVARGTLESATDSAYYVFGAIRGGRGQNAPATPTESLYDPMVVFPAKLTVGQKAEAPTKIQMRGQAVDVTMILELAAVENVTVPKGTFENCLKLVYTTKAGDREMKRTVWYAKGVGFVKTEQMGGGQTPAPRVAELMDYQLAPEK